MPYRRYKYRSRRRHYRASSKKISKICKKIIQEGNNVPYRQQYAWALRPTDCTYNDYPLMFYFNPDFTFDNSEGGNDKIDSSLVQFPNQATTNKCPAVYSDRAGTTWTDKRLNGWTTPKILQGNKIKRKAFKCTFQMYFELYSGATDSLSVFTAQSFQFAQTVDDKAVVYTANSPQTIEYRIIVARAAKGVTDAQFETYLQSKAALINATTALNIPWDKDMIDIMKTVKRRVSAPFKNRYEKIYFAGKRGAQNFVASENLLTGIATFNALSLNRKPYIIVQMLPDLQPIGTNHVGMLPFIRVFQETFYML